LPDEKDFKPIITKAKAEGVDGIVLVSYVNDASLLVQQIRGQGITVPIVSNGSQATADFPKLAGAAAEGVYVAGDFTADDPRPEVVQFVKKWQAKYPGQDIDYFAVHAYDSLKLAAAIIAKAAESDPSISRKAVRDAFAQVRDVPSVIYGKIAAFNPQTRRVDEFLGARLIIKDGKEVAWTGK
jgi:branched-chain amino acid transport system substrate-binding protein